MGSDQCERMLSWKAHVSRPIVRTWGCPGAGGRFPCELWWAYVGAEVLSGRRPFVASGSLWPLWVRTSDCHLSPFLPPLIPHLVPCIFLELTFSIWCDLAEAPKDWGWWSFSASVCVNLHIYILNRKGVIFSTPRPWSSPLKFITCCWLNPVSVTDSLNAKPTRT